MSASLHVADMPVYKIPIIPKIIPKIIPITVLFIVHHEDFSQFGKEINEKLLFIIDYNEKIVMFNSSKLHSIHANKKHIKQNWTFDKL